MSNSSRINRVPHIASRALSRAFIGLVVCLALSIGCATHAQRFAKPRRLVFDNQLELARESYEDLTGKKDAELAKLELATIELFSGDAYGAENRLCEVRDAFDAAEEASLSESAVSLWTDSTKRSYSGEDYEKICVRILLALAELAQDASDAESYSLQITEKQTTLAEHAELKFGPNYRDKYRPVPFADYLVGMIRESNWQDYDVAERQYRKVLEGIPDQPQVITDLQRVTTRSHCNPGMGVVHVIALVGRGPIKVEELAEATSDALLIADRILAASGTVELPPTIAPIKVPTIHIPDQSISAVGIDVNGEIAGSTQMLADISEIARLTFESKRNQLIAQAVARRLLKKAAIYAAKESSNSNGLQALTLDLAGVAWEFTENADTRCWGLLPDTIQHSRLELPVGKHFVQLRPTLNGHAIGPGQGTELTVEDGRDLYVICYFPSEQLVGNIVVGPDLY